MQHVTLAQSDMQSPLILRVIDGDKDVSVEITPAKAIEMGLAIFKFLRRGKK